MAGDRNRPLGLLLERIMILIVMMAVWWYITPYIIFQILKAMKNSSLYSGMWHRVVCWICARDLEKSWLHPRFEDILY
jgi:hypothetical protein